MNVVNLREIQHIIIKYSTYKIKDAMDLNIKTWKQRERNKRRRKNKHNQNKTINTEIKHKNGTIIEYLN